MSRKAKYNVHRFVEVMTGGKFVLEDGKDGARALAYEAMQKMQALQAQLNQLDVHSAQLDTSITAYNKTIAQVLGLAGGARTRGLEKVLEDTKESLKQKRADVAVWLAQAQTQKDAAKACKDKIAAQRARLKDMQLPEIRQAMTTWLAALDDQVDKAQTKDVLSLKAAHGRLARLDQEFAALDLDRYYTLAAQMAGQQGELASACDLMQGVVSTLPRGPLRQMWEDRLVAIRARQQALQGQPVQDLPGLIERSQELADLKRELGVDPAALQLQLDQYQAASDALLQQMNTDLLALGNLPDAPSIAALKQEITAWIAKVNPPDLTQGMPGLAQSMALLLGEKTRYETSRKKRAETRVNFEDHAAWSAQSMVLWNALDALAKERDDSPAVQSLRANLDLLKQKIRPAESFPSAKELSSERVPAESLLELLQNTSIDEYLQRGDDCRQALAAAQRAFDDQSRLVDGLDDSPAKTALQLTLQNARAELRPLESLATVDEIKQAAEKAAELEQRVQAMDAAALIGKHQEHIQALADVRARIDAKVNQMAGLGAVAQRVLRAKFMEDLSSELDAQPLDELQGKLDSLAALAQKIDNRKLPDDPELKKRTERADQRAAQLRSRIPLIGTDALRDEAQKALDVLETNLAQVKLGSRPDDVPLQLYVGDESKGGVRPAHLRPNEIARVLDAALKALDDALENEDGLGAQMMGFEKGGKFASRLCDINAKQVAFGASHRGISAVEAMAVNIYTGADYGPMNRNRRGQQPDARLSFLNKVCDQALAKMPEYPAVAWPAYRAETAWSQEVVDKRYAKGRQFMTGVLWSSGARGTVELSGGSPRFVHVIYGKRGRDVAALSNASGEGAKVEPGHVFNKNSGRGEVLFPADCHFLVEDRQDPEGAPESIRYSPVSTNVRITTRLKEVTHG